jgi:hypothetical protein
MFELRLDQGHLENRCLTFLILYGVSEPETSRDDEPVLPHVAQTYSLEAGSVWWPDPTGQEQLPPISLRNSRLSSWEPMFIEKFELMALEKGVQGEDVDLIAPWQITDAKAAAVVVSPEGFVFHWNYLGNVSISDVGRLADLSQPLTDTTLPMWRTYQPKDNRVIDVTDMIEDRYEPRPAALVGNCVAPKITDPRDVSIETLADCAKQMARPLRESGNDPYGDYTPQAAEFVRRQFGVDVDAIDWHAANKARLISDSFGSYTPFDPASACAALRLAIVNNRVKHTAPAAIDQAFSRELATRIQRHLKPSGPAQ